MAERNQIKWAVDLNYNFGLLYRKDHIQGLMNPHCLTRWINNWMDEWIKGYHCIPKYLLEAWNLRNSQCVILFYFFYYFFLFLLYFTLQYCIGFAIHWHESTMGVYKLPILNPPPTSHPISSLWIIPMHQPQASCILYQT